MLTTAVSAHMPHVVSPMGLEMTGISCQIANTPNDVKSLAQAINGSAVGQIVPRTGGQFTNLTFYISPAQEAMAISRLPKGGGREHANHHQQQHSKPETAMLGGFCASVGLRGTADGRQHSLPLISRVNLVKDADGYK